MPHYGQDFALQINDKPSLAFELSSATITTKKFAALREFRRNARG